MTTEREYREWQANKKQNRQKPKKKSNNTGWIFTLLLLGSGYYTFINYPQQSLEIKDKIETFIEEKSDFNISWETASKEKVIPGVNQQLYVPKYEQIDRIARSIKYQGQSVKELAKILEKHSNTEAEKARIIYTWITENIEYDVVSFLQKNYRYLSAEEVLSKRQAICSGYANLYKALGKAMGLKTIIIEGYAKSSSYIVGEDNDVNHAWNAVKIDGRWYLVDATWGAGTVNEDKFSKKFNPFYFATKPQEFIYTHFPRQTNWQLLSQPYSRKQFDSLPEISAQFFRTELKTLSHKNLNIVATNGIDIILQAPTDTIVVADLKQGSRNFKNAYTLVQKKDTLTIVSVSFPAPGNYELEIFSKKRGEKGNYPHVLTYKIQATERGEAFPLTYGDFTTGNVYLYEPTLADLPDNKSIYFKLAIEQAIDVQVIDLGINKWTQLHRVGNLFTGNVFLSAGKIQIAAKYPGDRQYRILTEYN